MLDEQQRRVLKDIGGYACLFLNTLGEWMGNLCNNAWCGSSSRWGIACFILLYGLLCGAVMRGKAFYGAAADLQCCHAKGNAYCEGADPGNLLPLTTA